MLVSENLVTVNSFGFFEIGFGVPLSVVKLEKQTLDHILKEPYTIYGLWE